MIGKVTGSQVLPNKDGVVPVLILQCEITDPDDVQSIELFRGSGIDENPLNGSKVHIVQISPSWKIAIAIDDGILPDLEQGEKEIYSAVGKPPAAVKFARVKCLKDGKVEIVSQPAGLEAAKTIMSPDGTIETVSKPAGILKSTVKQSPDGSIEASNSFGGNYKLNGTTGQFSANDNFTVDI